MPNNAQNKAFIIRYNIPLGDESLQLGRDLAVYRRMYDLLQDPQLIALTGKFKVSLEGGPRKEHIANGADAPDAPTLKGGRAWTVVQLQDELRKRGLSVTGSKSVLMARLRSVVNLEV